MTFFKASEAATILLDEVASFDYGEVGEFLAILEFMIAVAHQTFF